MMTDSLPDINRLWDYSQPVETESRMRGLLPQAEGRPGYRAALLTQIARAQGLQRRFEEAHATLDEAEAVLPTAAGEGAEELPEQETVVAGIRLLLERGRVYNSSGRPEEARPLFEEALAAARATGEDYHAADAAHMLGIVAPVKEQLTWHEEALAIAEKSDEERARGWLGPLYNNIGWTYHDLGEYEKALRMFQKGLAWREAKGQESEARMARWAVGRALRSLGRVQEAYKMQQALLAEFQRVGEENGYVHEEAAECLREMGRDEEAKEHFARAYELLAQDPWLAEQERERLRRLRRLGGL